MIVVAMAVVTAETIVAPLVAIAAVAAVGRGSSRDRSGDHEDRRGRSRWRVMDKSHVWSLVFVGLYCSHGPCGCFSTFRTSS